MDKLPVKLFYIKRCGYCNKDMFYIMRDTNVNSNITDDDARRMAVQHVGDTEGEWCEHCGLITQHTRVAYDFTGVEKEGTL